jgi:hypothetical protein
MKMASRKVTTMTTHTVEVPDRTNVLRSTVREPPRDTVDLDDLAYRLASRRPIELEAELARFIRHAAAAGASPLLLSILADPHQPDIVRQRAFGRVACDLAFPRHFRSHSPLDVPRAA